MTISVVIPVYNCNKTISALTSRLKNVLISIDNYFEIIFINDASLSNDWEMVLKETEKDPRVKGVNLSRNFGQHYAITAGLEQAKGDWIIVMDGDLQDKPEEITKLYNKAQEGYDIVLAHRIDRQDSFLKKLFSKWFYKTLAYLTDTEQNAEVANFGIYNKKVIRAILSMHDKTRYFPAMVRWVGFKRTEVEVEHAQRTEGKSSYNFRGLLRLAVNTILAFSDKPLRLTMKLGILISSLSFILAIITFIRAVTGQISVLGYSSMIISIWFLSGIIITLIGMTGLYIGRIFDQVKNRPSFIISETVNMDNYEN